MNITIIQHQEKISKQYTKTAVDDIFTDKTIFEQALLAITNFNLMKIGTKPYSLYVFIDNILVSLLNYNRNNKLNGLTTVFDMSGTPIEIRDYQNGLLKSIKTIVAPIVVDTIYFENKSVNIRGTKDKACCVCGAQWIKSNYVHNCEWDTN